MDVIYRCHAKFPGSLSSSPVATKTAILNVISGLTLVKKLPRNLIALHAPPQKSVYILCHMLFFYMCYVTISLLFSFSRIAERIPSKKIVTFFLRRFYRTVGGMGRTSIATERPSTPLSCTKSVFTKKYILSLMFFLYAVLLGCFAAEWQWDKTIPHQAKSWY
jgi:hypothetical protein